MRDLSVFRLLSPMKNLFPAFLAFLAVVSSASSQEVLESVPVAIPVAEIAPVSEAVIPKAPEPIESILRLQIFLDGQLFGPGKVDGRPGDFTTKALKRYQKAQGLPETEVDGNTLDLSTITDVYTTYTIKPEDLKFVGEVPTQPSAQSKKKYLPYDSLLEFLTERFHCSPDLIEFINRPMKMSTLKVGDVVKVPNVQPFFIEEMTVASIPEVPEYKTRVIKIDTREKMLDLYDGEKLLASLPITPGSGHVATPPGTWRIVGIAQMPTFRWDKSVLEYGIRSSTFYELPIGPNNPVGVMWIGLNKPGIGIHGTNQPQTIGRSASHGCMRTANWDVVRLSKMISKGMTVIIEGPPPIPRPVVVQNKPATSTQMSKATPAQAAPPAEERKFKWFWQK